MSHFKWGGFIGGVGKAEWIW